MIDTDKYEGHKPAPWVWDINGVGQYESLRCNELEDYSDERKRIIASKIGAYDVPTAELIADAPLLLVEVKRLREAMKTMLDDMNNASPEEDIEYWLDTWKHWLKEVIE
tara:strand:+ start:44 stop:370 length:327 start_codon:yes stop_codon:yes gene_type:complete